MYSLSKLAATAGLGLAFALVVPAAANATTPVACNGVVEGPGQGRTTDSVAGVCVSGLGYTEVGASGTEVYAVGSSDAFGYVAVSNYENGTKSPCGPATPDGNEGGTGTNSGGCYGTNNNPIAAPLPLACGDSTGPWNNTSRDGCRADQEDVADAIDAVLGLIP
jgi:hypothetical protein